MFVYQRVVESGKWLLSIWVECIVNLGMIFLKILSAGVPLVL